MLAFQHQISFMRMISIWICMQRSALNALHSPRYSLPPMIGLDTVVDLRGEEAYKYRARNRLVATMRMNETMEIQFKLKVQFLDRTSAFLQWISILFFEGATVKMTIYLNERGQFGILHYDRDLDQTGSWKRMLLVDLSLIPQEIDEDRYRHFSITILNDYRIWLSVDGYVNTSEIDRDICPVDDVMYVWLDSKGFKVEGSIKDLVIRAR